MEHLSRSVRGLRFLPRCVCVPVLLVVCSISRAEVEGGTGKRVRERLCGLRIPFIANSGQIDAAVSYYAPTFAGTVFVTRDGRIVYSLLAETRARARDE